MLIDAAILDNRNVIREEAEEILNLAIEIQCIWNLKANVIPLIIGATGTNPTLFRRYFPEELQKTAILGRAHILRIVLMLKYNRFNIVDLALYAP